MVQLKSIKDPTDLLASFNFSQKTPKSKCSSCVSGGGTYKWPANDPGPQMIPVPQMIPGPEMIPANGVAKNREWRVLYEWSMDFL